MTLPEAAQAVTSFDGATTAQVRLARPDRRRDFEDLGSEPSAPMPRGAGTSYAAASFIEGGRSWDLRRFNRLLSFDEETGVLVVEAGATLGKVYDFLRPKGRYLPVQPGHPAITIGGCLAADVHGKNQRRDGNFSQWVEGVDVLHPTKGERRLDRGQSAEDEALLDLTLGGYGLTGPILRARLKTRALGGPTVLKTRRPVANLAATAAVLEEFSEALGLYSFNDLTRQGSSFGKGWVVTLDFDGQPGSHPSLAQGTKSRPLADLPAPRGPATEGAPAFFGPWTTPAFERVYSGLELRRTSPQRIALEDALFPVLRAAAYFRLFGSAGFHEVQLCVPTAAWEAFVSDLEQFLEAQPQPITLASTKLFGGEPDRLRFAGTGICLALNFPRRPSTEPFLQRLDELAVAYKARPNIGKDSRLPRAVAEATLPGIEPFRRELREYDPARLFRSELSERLGL